MTNWLNKNKYLFLLLALGFSLIFSNLTDRPLWEDEATSAVLAKNIISSGYPAAWDGRNLIVHEDTGFKLDSGFAYYIRPWLEFYIIALFFMIFGISTFTARLPFAIFGMLSIILFYRLICKVSNKRIANFSSFLMVISIPLLLHIRQCGYFSLLIFITLLTIISYLNLINKKNKISIFNLIFCLTTLFYTQYLVFLGVFLGIASHMLFSKNDKNNLKTITIIGNSVFILTAPWFFYLGVLGHTHEFTQQIPFLFRLDNLMRYFLYINNHIFPFIFIPLLFYFRNRAKPLSVFFFVIIFVLLSLTLLGPFPFFRYLVCIAPFFFYYLAVIFYKIKEKYNLWSYVFLVILIVTRFFNLLPLYALSNMKFSKLPLPVSWKANPDVMIRLNLYNFYLGKETSHFWSYIPEYIYELTHPSNGPLKCIISFLKNNAQPEDFVLTNYDNCPIIFYTNLRCVGRMIKKNAFLEKNLPNYIFSSKETKWLIPRQGRDMYFFRKFLDENNITEDSRALQAFKLNCPDIWLDSNPDPYFHHFKDPDNMPNIVVLKNSLVYK